MNKVEEVARAIRECDIELYIARAPDVDQGAIREAAMELAQNYEALARAALSALLEPSPEMIEAATSRSDNGDRPTMYHSIWKAMIEAAAREK